MKEVAKGEVGVRNLRDCNGRFFFPGDHQRSEFRVETSRQSRKRCLPEENLEEIKFLRRAKAEEEKNI
ncbi:hypothetical protein K1719_027266 [Acacia pycnantha]|nr:hypothetical protein K1719_027266 [Acacia pycnantha]